MDACLLGVALVLPGRHFPGYEALAVRLAVQALPVHDADLGLGKAARRRRHERRGKRGGGKVLAMTDLAASDPDSGLADVVGPEPTPEFAAQVAEECGRLLDLLTQRGLRSVALAKMEGCTVAEIAQRLGCAPRTVERKLALIRDLWSQELPP
jgi:DNA-directed RNA polymerase specialized sigma24 family protein